MKAIVLCAGLGTRLGNRVALVPKPLLPVGGRPLLHWTLAWLAREGVEHVRINTHYLANAVVDSIGNGNVFGVRASFVHEPALLGTAGTVRAAAEWVGADDVLVVYGDLWCNQALAPFVARRDSADAVLLVHQRRESNSVVVVDEDMCITGFLERPTAEARAGLSTNWVNSGVQLLSSAFVQALPGRVPCDLPRDVYAPGLAARWDWKLAAVPLTGDRVAIDSPERHDQANHLAQYATWAPPRSPHG